MTKITAQLLTGFLGAGKTTLLNRLLTHENFSSAAVLVNEFGDIGLEHAIVEGLGAEAVLLRNGCLCCTLRGEVREAVLALFARRQAGEIPPFDRLIVETAGLADPAPLLATFAADPVLRHHFCAGPTVAVIDVPTGTKNLARFGEAVRQLAVADRIAVSKADLAAADEVQKLRTVIEGLNPVAEVTVLGPDGDVAALFSGAPVGAPRRWVAEPAGHFSARAVVVSATRPLPWAAFALWLAMLLHRHGSKILRVKGVLRIDGAGGAVVLHGVQHLIHPPAHLPGPASDSRLLFITDGHLGDLQASFDAFVR